MSNALVDIRAQLRRELEEQKNRVAAPSKNKISTLGKTFTLPDGRSNPGPLNLIVLDWRVSHEYYTGIYDPSKPAIPTCWAKGLTLDIGPDPTVVEKPKSESCVTCQYNQFGSGPTGKNKACKESRILAVVPPDFTADVMPLTLEVSPTAIRSFDGWVTLLKQRGIHPIQTVVEIGFRADLHYPSLVFSGWTELPDDKLAEAWALRDKANLLLDRDAA